MVFIPAQEEYWKKRDYFYATEEEHLEEEDSNEETKESWAALDREKTSESEIEEIPSSDSLCVQNTNQQKEEDLNVMVEEETERDPNVQVD